MPAHEIKLLPLIEIELESSFLVLARNMGIRTRVPTWGVLILGNPVGPILLVMGLSGPDEIFPGIVCEAAAGHTEGSMNITVELAGGETACICGDVIYDIHNQIVDPTWQVLDYEPATTGNHGTTKRQEKAA